MALYPARTILLVLSALLVALPLRAAPTDANPDWKQLSAVQQEVLAPLKDQWKGFDAPRKRKWMEIADRQPQMSLYQQWQLKQRLNEWAKLTPEQREAARERYKDFEQLPPAKKENVRQQYEMKQQMGEHYTPAPASPQK
jgi:hypothetical protein